MLCHQGTVKLLASCATAAAFKILPGWCLYKDCFMVFQSSLLLYTFTWHVLRWQALSVTERLFLSQFVWSCLHEKVPGDQPGAPGVLSKDNGPSPHWDTLRDGRSGSPRIRPLFTPSLWKDSVDELTVSGSLREPAVCSLIPSLYLRTGVWFMPNRTDWAGQLAWECGMRRVAQEWAAVPPKRHVSQML